MPRPKEAQAAAGRDAASRLGLLAGGPPAQAALTRPEKPTSRAARISANWPDAETVSTKLDDDLTKLGAVLVEGDADWLRDEVGGMLFVLANLPRKSKLDREAALRWAIGKFARRFGAVERMLAEAGATASKAGRARTKAAWQAVKRAFGAARNGTNSVVGKYSSATSHFLTTTTY